MKRVLRRVGLAVILGVVSTVAVAWVLSLGLLPRRSVSTGSRFEWNLVGQGGALIYRYRWLGATELNITTGPVNPPESGPTGGEVGDLVPWWAAALVPPWSEWTRDSEYVHRLIEVRGWPMPAMWWSMQAEPDPGYWPLIAMNGWVLEEDWKSRTPGFPGVKPLVLPLRIAPEGFAIDAAFYGAIWALLLLGIPALRRRRRRARGRCVSCGYDLRGQAACGCPECGAGRPAMAVTEGAP